MSNIKTKRFKAINPNGDLTRGDYGEVVEFVHVVTSSPEGITNPAVGEILVWDSTFGWQPGDSWASPEAHRLALKLNIEVVKQPR